MRDGRTKTTAELEFEGWAKKKAREVVRRIEPRSGQRQACSDDALKAVFALQEYADILKSGNVHLSKEWKDHLREFALCAVKLGHVWKKITVIGWIHLERDISRVGDGVDTVLDFGRFCGELVNTMEKPPNNMEAMIKAEAVRHAYWLIKRHAAERPTAGRNVTGELEARSQFSRVAASLWGDNDADLTTQCKAFIRKKRKSAKLVAQIASA